MAGKKKKRKRRKPAPQEAIYRSVTGATINTIQKIAEDLTLCRAKHIGLHVSPNNGTVGWVRYYEHHQLRDYYQDQFGDASNAIRRYGGRETLDCISRNEWITKSDYGEHPLRIRRFIAIMRAYVDTAGSEEIPEGPKETPQVQKIVIQHQPRRIIEKKYIRDY